MGGTSDYDRERAPRRQRGIGSILWDVFDGRKILTGVAAVVVAGVGTIFTPVGERIYRMFYPDRVEVQLHANRTTLRPGQGVLIEVLVKQLSSKPIEKGSVAVTFDTEKLALDRNSPTLFTTEDISGISSITGKNPLVFHSIVETEGETSISAVFSNRHGTFPSNPMALKLIKIGDVRGPRQTSRGTDLSGTWEIAVSAAHGRMTIHHRVGSSVNGTFDLEREDKGVITGLADGKRFLVRFLKGGNDGEMRRIDAIFERNSEAPKFIEMNGCAYRLMRDSRIVQEDAPNLKDCSKPVNYVGYRWISGHKFYAVSEMD